MPMDQTERLLELAVRLREAARERKWAVLTMLNHELRDVLGSLSEKPGLSDAERNALALVKPLHVAAMAVLGTELERLAKQMTGLGEHRKAWDAYSATGNDEGNKPS
jgi:hypothetical protein